MDSTEDVELLGSGDDAESRDEALDRLLPIGVVVPNAARLVLPKDHAIEGQMFVANARRDREKVL